MKYTTTTDVGDRKRRNGINEDSVAVAVFEHGHRDGVLDGPGPSDDPAGDRTDADVHTGEQATGGSGAGDAEDGEDPGDPTRSVAAFALADGAGGHDAGDAASYVASTVACERLAETAIRAARADPGRFGVRVGDATPEKPDERALRAAVEEAVVAAHREVLAYARASGNHALTTLVAGVCVDGDLHYGWVGDSRAYLVNGERREIARLTKDHAVVERLHDAGEIDDVEALVHPRGNEITRALGGAGEEDPETATVEVETNTVPMYAEDVLLVTSDGLIDAQTAAPRLYERYVESDRPEAAAERVREQAVTEGEIRDRVLAADSLSDAAADLIELANDRGGKDNLSLIMLKDGSLPETPTDGGLPVRAIDPDEPVEDRQTVIVRED